MSTTIIDPNTLKVGLGTSNKWYELEVEWKTDEPNAVIKFVPPQHDYDRAYDDYTLCVAAAVGHKEVTPAKLITLSLVWRDGEDEIFEVLQSTSL